MKETGDKAIGDTLKSCMDDPVAYSEALVGIYMHYDNIIKVALAVSFLFSS